MTDLPARRAHVAETVRGDHSHRAAAVLPVPPAAIHQGVVR